MYRRSRSTRFPPGTQGRSTRRSRVCSASSAKARNLVSSGSTRKKSFPDPRESTPSSPCSSQSGTSPTSETRSSPNATASPKTRRSIYKEHRGRSSIGAAAFYPRGIATADACSSQSMAESLGYPTEFVLIRGPGRDDFSHIYSQVDMGLGRPVPADTIMNGKEGRPFMELGQEVGPPVARDRTVLSSRPGRSGFLPVALLGALLWSLS